MKNILFGTTALVAASFAGSAMAQFELSIGGFMNAGVGVGQITEGDTGAPSRVSKDFHIIRDAEIIFTAEQTLDNGITIGIKVELEAGTSETGIDESAMYISGSFGRIIIGSDDNAYGHGGSSVAIDTGYTFIPGEIGTGDSASDDMGVQYYTPSFAGFSAGVSYQPSGADGGNVDTSEDAVNSEDYFAARLRYAGEFGGLSFAIGGAFGTGDTDDAGTTETLYGAGLSLGFDTMGGTISINGIIEVRETDPQPTAATDSFVIGGDIGYATGPWAFALGVGYREDDSTGTASDIERFRVGFAASYELGEGVDLEGRVDYGDYDASGSASDLDGFSGSLVLGVDF